MTNAAVHPVPAALSHPEPVLERESTLPVGNELPGDPLRVPAGRDLEIYEEVVFARRSQRNVAAEYGVSQPRVFQILRQVAAWLVETTPGFAAGLTPEQKLKLAHYNAEQQLTHHHQCLMQAWRDSQRQEKQSRTVIEHGARRTVETERKSQGDPRYLRESGRVALALLKLAEWSPKGEPKGEQPQASGRNPPDGNLSLAPKKEPDSKPIGFSAAAATPLEIAACAAAAPGVEPENAALREMKNPLSLGPGPLVPEKARRRLQRPSSERLAGDGPLCHENREELAAKRKAFFGRGTQATPLPQSARLMP